MHLIMPHQIPPLNLSFDEISEELVMDSLKFMNRFVRKILKSINHPPVDNLLRHRTRFQEFILMMYPLYLSNRKDTEIIKFCREIYTTLQGTVLTPNDYELFGVSCIQYAKKIIPEEFNKRVKKGMEDIDILEFVIIYTLCYGDYSLELKTYCKNLWEQEKWNKYVSLVCFFKASTEVVEDKQFCSILLDYYFDKSSFSDIISKMTKMRYKMIFEKCSGFDYKKLTRVDIEIIDNNIFNYAKKLIKKAGL